MFKNYFKIAWRNLSKNKGYSAINIGGLAVGMAVAILIGLWIWDELSYNKYHQNYDRIVRVMQNQNFNGEIGTQVSNPYLLSSEIR
ncbi:MAG: ABC transporter permease, partial [Chitinophagaceae bacterium]